MFLAGTEFSGRRTKPMIDSGRGLPLKTMAVVTGLFMLTLAWSLRAESPPPAAKAAQVRPAPAGTKTDEGGKRLREGTRLIDVAGRFESNGDRWVFFLADTEESYKVLENLALERIHKVLEETRASDKPQWIVSGTMTEFAGANYLLVSKAVIKPQAETATSERARGGKETQPPSPGS
jgi:hypothetical protein